MKSPATAKMAIEISATLEVPGWGRGPEGLFVGANELLPDGTDCEVFGVVDPPEGPWLTGALLGPALGATTLGSTAGVAEDAVETIGLTLLVLLEVTVESEGATFEERTPVGFPTMTGAEFEVTPRGPWLGAIAEAAVEGATTGLELMTAG